MESKSLPQLRCLRHVALCTTAFDESVDFYTSTWGLELVTRDDDVACLRGSGPEHHVFELRRADHNGLDHISFGMAAPAEIDAAAYALSAAGVQVIEAPARSARPGGGYRCRFLDPDGRVVELSAEVHSVPARSREEPVPIKVSHAVLNTVDIDAAVDFYTTALGLRVSDWSEHQMVFLRCNRDHHCVAFNEAEWTSPNHVAFEVPGVDHFMRGIGRLRQQGVEPLWGPGRHGPGNNTFCYFVDPAGMVVEYTSEVQQVDESWLPRIWQRTPELSDLWGTAGPPSPVARRHMTGVPDPGPYTESASDGA